MKNIKYIAHRGAPFQELENTKESFIVAGNKKVFGIETDIIEIKDHSLIIFHDDDLNRLAGKNVMIRDLTIKDVKEVILNQPTSQFRPYHLFPSRIAFIGEYLRICKHYQKTPVLDLKWGLSNDGIDRLVLMLQEEDLVNQTIMLCYTFESCLYIKNRYPNINLQYLVGSKYSQETIEICVKHALNIDLYHKFVTKELVDYFHDHNLEVNCWTIDDLDELKRVIACGVDYVTSNVFENMGLDECLKRIEKDDA